MANTWVVRRRRYKENFETEAYSTAKRKNSDWKESP